LISAFFKDKKICATLPHVQNGEAVAILSHTGDDPQAERGVVMRRKQPALHYYNARLLAEDVADARGSNRTTTGSRPGAPSQLASLASLASGILRADRQLGLIMARVLPLLPIQTKDENTVGRLAAEVNARVLIWGRKGWNARSWTE